MTGEKCPLRGIDCNSCCAWWMQGIDREGCAIMWISIDIEKLAEKVRL